MRSFWFGKIVFLYIIIFILIIFCFLASSFSAEDKPIILPSISPPYFQYYAPAAPARRFTPKHLYHYPNYMQYQNYYFSRPWASYSWPNYYFGPRGYYHY